MGITQAIKRMLNPLRLLDRQEAAAVKVQVDDSPGWGNLTNRSQDYSVSEMMQIYQDTLTAWRKNPIAWRIIAITTDYVVGDNLAISSPKAALQRFIKKFWHHPQNRLNLRLQEMSDELARAGDLFVVLFRNQNDGMSYIRFVTKDRIEKIETAENDWERELAYYERREPGSEPKQWLSPNHPEAAESDAVMLHYAVNRPTGALMGDSDLTTMLPWLQRYSRMLEDRVRLHWAIRSFLWFVTVPTNAVEGKKEQYRQPPEAGSVVVKDESEDWEVKTPNLQANDVRHDLQAVRQMIDAGSGYPPHWRGEPGDANLATATAMQGPTERHLLRRQQYFVYLLQDILFHAYQRSADIGRNRRLSSENYGDLFSAVLPEISRWDNESLARAANQISDALGKFSSQLPKQSPKFIRWALEIMSRFSGEPLTDEEIGTILEEAGVGAPSMDPSKDNAEHAKKEADDVS